MVESSHLSHTLKTETQPFLIFTQIGVARLKRFQLIWSYRFWHKLAMTLYIHMKNGLLAISFIYGKLKQLAKTIGV